MVSKKEKLGNIQNSNFAFFYGCETWSFTLRKKHRLRLYENRVMMKIFGPIRNGVTGVE